MTERQAIEFRQPRGWLRLLKRELVGLCLIGSTLGLLAWQHWGMDRTVVLDPGSGNLHALATDDLDDGGTSICRAETDSAGWWLHYDVRKGRNWSFCGIALRFSHEDSSKGRDLSGFDTLVVNMVRMSGTNRQLQIQIKGRDPRLRSETGITALKYHDMILAPVDSGSSRTSMPLGNFVIPPWWAGRHQVPARNLDPHLGEIQEIEFATSPDKILLGTGSFGIRSLELRGKWIRQDLLIKVLLALWLATIGGGLVGRLFRAFQDIRDLQSQTNRLKDLSERDPLTLLHNRRGLENRLAGMVQASTLQGPNRMGLLMVDLDNFKIANDSLGHDAGDQVLRLLAGILQEEMRPTNLAARWGGEEFILLLPGIPPERLAPAAERVRYRIESDLHYQGRRFTASIGAALGDLERFEDLVKRADHALYRAKANGRNRVEIAA